MNEKELRVLDAWILENIFGGALALTGNQCEHYSTNPAAAMDVLKKCAEKNSFYDTIHVGHASDGWEVYSFNRKGSTALETANYVASTPTLELAICLFAKELFAK